MNNQNPKTSLRQKDKENKHKQKEETKKVPLTEVIISWCKLIGAALIFVMMLHGILVASFIVPTGSMENTVMPGDFLLVSKIFGPSTPQIIPFFNIPLPYVLLPSPCTPEKGDVIVFIFQGMRDEVKSQDFQYYLKRCVAEPGDTLQIIDNELYVNGVHQPLPSDGKIEKEMNTDPSEIYQTFPIGMNYTRNNYGPIRIPQKGDTIFFRNKLDILQNQIFIEREGHTVNYTNESILIDDAKVNFYVVEQDYYFGMGDNRDMSLDSRFFGFIPRKAILGSPIVCWLSWEMHDEYNRERNIFQKFANIRWSRMGKSIN
jgi:signal peptidase I